MITQARILTLLFLALLNCAIPTLSASSTTRQLATGPKIPCDPNNRPQQSTCDSTSQPVCAYYTQDCPLSICGTDAYNPCYACSDSNTIYYRTGHCNLDIKVQKCYTCDQQLTPSLFQHYDPVCAIPDGCTAQSCRATFDNSCEACSSQQYGWYTTGICKKDRLTCPANRKFPRFLRNPVCAFFLDSNNILQHTTVSNRQRACSDKAVVYYIRGKCKQLEKDNDIYCLPNVKPTYCSHNYNPVCGFFNDPTNGISHSIIANSCSACKNPVVLYYEPGPCIFHCERRENVAVDCAGSFVGAVCGTYTDPNGIIQHVSLKNACIACYNFSPLIDTYTDGLCPGDVGISCTTEPSGFLNGMISPICGLTYETCTDSSCRTSYSEPYAACVLAGSALYVPGLCPGDQGISCEPYRPSAVNTLCGSDPVFIYQNVCGYSQLDCNDSSCKTTFTDHCAACADSSILFFNEGPCT